MCGECKHACRVVAVTRVVLECMFEFGKSDKYHQQKANMDGWEWDPFPLASHLASSAPLLQF